MIGSKTRRTVDSFGSRPLLQEAEVFTPSDKQSLESFDDTLLCCTLAEVERVSVDTCRLHGEADAKFDSIPRSNVTRANVSIGTEILRTVDFKDKARETRSSDDSIRGVESLSISSKSNVSSDSSISTSSSTSESILSSGGGGWEGSG